jgi:hypothetical protein
MFNESISALGLEETRKQRGVAAPLAKYTCKYTIYFKCCIYSFQNIPAYIYRSSEKHHNIIGHKSKDHNSIR